jgi:Bacterial extracellular solute-binding proteins, family 5 Middle
MKVKNTRNNSSSTGTENNRNKLNLSIVGFWKATQNTLIRFQHPVRFYQESLYKVRKIWKIVWPINWSKLYNASLVMDTIKYTSQRMKIVLAVLLVCLSISFIALMGSFLNALTVETAASNGTFNEAIFGQTITKLNPALTLNSEAERKLVDLLYQPLYRLEYPNFLTSKDKVKIQPVLLESEPSWSSDNKVLNLKLNRNLKWSDGSELTSLDVVYTFKLLKEVNGNSDFRDIYANYKLTSTSPVDMELTQIVTNKGFNPQIKNLLNFYPISAKYFENKTVDEIANSPKSIANEVSSGYFSIPSKVKIDGKDIQNPVKDVSNNYHTLILERNKYNTYKTPLIQRFVVKIYNDLIDVGGTSGANSVERASVNKKVDLFVRQNNSENQISDQEIKSKFGLKQDHVPTNTYYIMYANLQSNQWLINNLLRKYVLCNLSEIVPPQTNFAKIDTNKQFLPIQLQDSFDPNCANSKAEMLDQQKAGVKPYSENANQILVDGENISLNILTLQEMLYMTKPIQDQLAAAGVQSTITTVKDTDELDRKISEKSYNLLLLPTTIISNDPYPMYGAKSRNIASINKNNRIGKAETKFGEGVEKLLKDYSESGLTNIDLGNQVKDFFKTEFVSVNMFSLTTEVNYSSKVNLQPPTKNDKSQSNDPNIFGTNLTFSSSIYDNLPRLYVETKRKFFWE